MLAVAATFGETVARRIVDEAAADLAVLVRTVNSALGESARDLPVVLAGGVLVHQPLLQDAVRQALVAPIFGHWIAIPQMVPCSSRSDSPPLR